MSQLAEGKVPRDCKMADVVPIYKGERRDDPLNYRSLSGTSVVAKICERIIKNKWTGHLEQNRVLREKQFGSREEKWCITNLMSYYLGVIDVVQERDGWADGFYFDIKMALDKLPHQKLL